MPRETRKSSKTHELGTVGDHGKQYNVVVMPSLGGPQCILVENTILVADQGNNELNRELAIAFSDRLV